MYDFQKFQKIRSFRRKNYSDEPKLEVSLKNKSTLKTRLINLKNL